MFVELTREAPRWYVARTKPNQEKIARAALMAERIDAYVPLMFRTSNKGEVYARPLFPGFVFLRLPPGAGGWFRVFSARGVTSVLGNGGKPSPVADSDVETVRIREMEAFLERELSPPSCTFEPGDPVRIKKGQKFGELEAVFLEQNDKKRCRVLLTLFGAQFEAEAELAQLEAAE